MCAEISGLWTTDAAPAGHQVVSYTQVNASEMLALAAACSGFEGVAPGYLGELAPTTTGANNCRIATGGAMVDGKYYKNDANIDVVIPSAAAGETRIDRVVVRATWANFEAEVTRIAGTSAPAPVAPPVIQTTGVTYDIQICQVLVDSAGAITITDERKWAIVDTDESTLEDALGLLRVKDLGVTSAKLASGAVGTTAKLANDVVDDTKVGDRVAQFYRRQGGSATIWTISGTDSRTPGAVRQQAGAIEWTGGAAAEGTILVTFPTAFSFAPLVFTQIFSTTAYQIITLPISISASQVLIKWYDLTTSHVSLVIFWFAVGTE